MHMKTWNIYFWNQRKDCRTFAKLLKIAPTKVDSIRRNLKNIIIFQTDNGLTLILSIWLVKGETFKLVEKNYKEEGSDS